MRTSAVGTHAVCFRLDWRPSTDPPCRVIRACGASGPHYPGFSAAISRATGQASDPRRGANHCQGSRQQAEDEQATGAHHLHGVSKKA